MSREDLHAPRERLTDQTIATHQAIVSLMEELQAMDWYRQRADDCDDAQLKAVLVHNMKTRWNTRRCSWNGCGAMSPSSQPSSTSSWAPQTQSLD